MAEPTLTPESVGTRLRRGIARVAGRLVDVLGPIGHGEHGLAEPLAFLASLIPTLEEADEGGDDAVHPVDLLVSSLDLSPAELDLLYLAAMPEEHEGLASVLRAIHPQRAPRPTVGLAARMFCEGHQERVLMRGLLEQGTATASGVLVVDGDVPHFERSLGLADRLWSVLHGIDVWPATVRPISGPAPTSGMEAWLTEGPARRAADALLRRSRVTILVTAATAGIALDRAAAIARHAGIPAVRLLPQTAVDAAVLRLIGAHCLARGVIPIVEVQAQEKGAVTVPTADRFPNAMMLAAATGAAQIEGTRPLLTVPVTPLNPVNRRRMWSELLPELANQAPELASRHPVEPAEAARTAADVRQVEDLDGRPMTMADVSASVRARAGMSLTSGVKLLTPTATWEQLVLAPEKLDQLKQAISRLRHQALVLDEWGFLAGRHGARGVRMMFAGPPGTGKTLSAEVLAHEIGVDVLAVDISRVVSKWIGETEKNLAEVFDAAERSQAVLFFDEADALFSRRTEVSDAHDRYANLETAYLLARLERFDGLAILASNLKSNLDPAFIRRLEFVVDFRPPGVAERELLWRCHLPPRAPIDTSVSVPELAARYPVVGALIRNATAAAAFAAAAEDVPISQGHLVTAIRAEYDKAGIAYPVSPIREAV